jgi:hypothetical protein
VVFSAIARIDLLSDNQMKKARSKLTFVPQTVGSGKSAVGSNTSAAKAGWSMSFSNAGLKAYSTQKQ